jgi:chitin disaccharide deacetylase
LSTPRKSQGRQIDVSRARSVIFNADDFGFTRGVNDGIVHCHLNGVLGATTLMANGDAFEHAVRLARENPTLDVGCHLVLVQGVSLATGKSLPSTPARLVSALLRGSVDVDAELRAQVERILNAGLRPLHLDTHKHTHLHPQVFSHVVRIAQRYGIPFVRLPMDQAFDALTGIFQRRLIARARLSATDHFTGFRLTGRLTEETMLGELRDLRPGTTEFMCHPGFVTDELDAAKTRLKESRAKEVEALTSPRVRALLDEKQISVSNYRALCGPPEEAA